MFGVLAASGFPTAGLADTANLAELFRTITNAAAALMPHCSRNVDVMTSLP